MLAKLSFLSLLAALSSLSAQEAVREMVTDRPDTTEAPYSVPAGLYQIEASFFDYSRDANRGQGSAEQWIFGQINFKIGVTHDSDLQIIVDSYIQARETGSPRATGFGDVTVRYKQNLWGNDSGTTAFALMPYVTIPTYTQVSEEAWSGGLIAPFAVSVSDRISLGFMGEMDIVHDAETNGYDLEWLHSATMGISLTEKLGMYLELVGIAGEDADYQGLFDTGLTYAVTDTLVFDAGVRLGLNRAAPDFGVFTGVSVRF